MHKVHLPQIPLNYQVINMSKKYIVMERGYEYNDENYSDGNGGSPKKIYNTKEEAVTEMKALNANSWKTHSHLYEYNYEDGYKDLINDEGKTIEEAVKEIGPMDVFYVVAVEEA